MLFWVFLFTSYSNAQTSTTDLTTGNLINPTGWTGVTYTNTTGVSYCCSGGPNPAINQDTNTIRFSWGYMAAAQAIALDKIFENGGMGIKVTGYNYKWQINNEGMTSGPLYGNVSLVGKNGNVLESYNYDYNRYIPGFETFSGTQKFSVDYGVPSLSSLNVTFIGSDNRFWAGYYGPRVRDVNVSLNYQVDSSKPPASTSLPTITTNVDTLSNTVESTSLNSTTQGLPDPVQQANSTGGTVTFDGQVVQQSSTTGTVQPSTTVQQTQQASVSTTITPSTTQEKSATSVGPGLGFALNLIAKNSDREKAIAQQVVTTSIAEAQAAGDKAQSIAISTANAAVTMSSSSAESNFSGTGLQVSTTTNRAMSVSTVSLAPVTTQVLQNTQTATSSSSVSQISLFQLATPTTIDSLQSTQNVGIFEVQVSRQQEIETPKQLTNFMTDRNNPLREIINFVPFQQATQEQNTSTVNRNAQANEASAGVVLERMATLPAGYTSYTNLVLKDANFYIDKPLYANQRVIDNVRVLRGLGSDLKHEQMVQDQYR